MNSASGSCTDNLQGVLHLSTLATASSKNVLQGALSAVLDVLTPEEPTQVIAQLYYEQACPSGSMLIDGPVITLPPPRVDLAFDDDSLSPVRKAWEEIVKVVGEDDPGEFMMFEDREGTDLQDDEYE